MCVCVRISGQGEPDQLVPNEGLESVTIQEAQASWQRFERLREREREKRRIFTNTEYVPTCLNPCGSFARHWSTLPSYTESKEIHESGLNKLD